MRSVSIRPTRIYIMKPLHIHTRELKYRCLYVAISLTLSLIFSWVYRYNIVHLYIFNVTETLYALDVGEEIRISLYLSLYSSILFTIPYILYNYCCYLSPGIYEYEFQKNIQRYLYILVHVVLVYVLTHIYIWPLIYKILIGIFLGTDNTWGVQLNYIPRLSSIILWSIMVPSVTSLLSLFPIFIISYVTVESLKGYRRFWYVFSVVIASLVCPAVPLIQFWCTFVLWIIYDITLMYLCVKSTSM